MPFQVAWQDEGYHIRAQMHAPHVQSVRHTRECGEASLQSSRNAKGSSRQTPTPLRSSVNLPSTEEDPTRTA